jgi:hypothetical protein
MAECMRTVMGAAEVCARSTGPRRVVIPEFREALCITGEVTPLPESAAAAGQASLFTQKSHQPFLSGS